MQERKQYLNEKEVARITGLALPTLRNYRHLGRGPAYSEIGRSVRYSLEEVLEFMESYRIETERI